MKEYSEFLNVDPYSLTKDEKEHMLNERLMDLTLFHMEKCQNYRKMVNALGFSAV